MLKIHDQVSLTREVMQFYGEATPVHCEKAYTFITVILSIAIERFTEKDQAKLRDAIRFTAMKHVEVYRKGEKGPYILHLLRTCIKLLNFKAADLDLIIASILHDVYEDTDAKLHEIEARYGRKVAQIVFLASKIDVDDEARKLFFPHDGKWLLLSFFERIKACPIPDIKEVVIFLKLADRIDNLETIAGMGATKIHLKIEETKMEFFIFLEILDEIAFGKPFEANIYDVIANARKSLERALVKAERTLITERRLETLT